MDWSDEMMAAAQAGNSIWRGTCPACGYKKAVSVGKGDSGYIAFCHACEESFYSGNSYRICESKPYRQNERKSYSADSYMIKRRVKRARDAWRLSKPYNGTLAEKYLLARCAIDDTFPKEALRAIRYQSGACHPFTKEMGPCLLGGVEHVGKSNLLGVQQIFLRADGLGKLDHEVPKISLGKLKGGAVRLGECGERLALSEGIETGLSFQTATGIPTWACLSTAGLRAIVLPKAPLATHITIAADHDEPGLRAADDLAERLTSEGRQVRIVFPPAEGTDFNDMIREAAND